MHVYRPRTIVRQACQCLLIGTFALLSTAFAPLGHAQDSASAGVMRAPAPGHRLIPPGAHLARMQLVDPGMVLVDGQQWLISPGASVRSERNLLVTRDALVEQRVVRFTSSPQGYVDKVWILDATEIEVAKQQDSSGGAAGVLEDLANTLLNAVLP